MTRRPFLAVATAVACALAIAGPAAAQGFTEHHTISVHTEAIWPGELVAFGGLYWGTAYGVCPAGPIHITFEQARRPDRSLGQVPATSVIPWSGGFSAQLRLPDDAHLGRGTLRFVQREREVRRRGGARTRDTRASVGTGCGCSADLRALPARRPTAARPPRTRRSRS